MYALSLHLSSPNLLRLPRCQLPSVDFKTEIVCSPVFTDKPDTSLVAQVETKYAPKSASSTERQAQKKQIIPPAVLKPITEINRKRENVPLSKIKRQSLKQETIDVFITPCNECGLHNISINSTKNIFTDAFRFNFGFGFA